MIVNDFELGAKAESQLEEVVQEFFHELDTDADQGQVRNLLSKRLGLPPPPKKPPQTNT